MKEKKIISRMVIEVLGSPKEHVEETMKQIVENLEAEKEMHMIHQTTYETEKQEKNNLWSTFCEAELQTDSIKKLMELCFDYMPSSVEIIEPLGMELETTDVSDMLNDLLARMHKYDMVLKNLHAENVTMKHDIELIKEAARKAVENKISSDKEKKKPKKSN